MGKTKAMSEAQTKASIIALARQQGVEEQVKKIIVKYEDAVKGAKNDYERRHIAHLGMVEIHRTIGCVGALVVDGVELIPDNPVYMNEINARKGLVKLD
jgi:hypothetical protein